LIRLQEEETTGRSRRRANCGAQSLSLGPASCLPHNTSASAQTKSAKRRHHLGTRLAAPTNLASRPWGSPEGGDSRWRREEELRRGVD
jgi:hypothetical protein